MRVVWRIYGRTKFWLGYLAAVALVIACGMISGSSTAGPAGLIFAVILLVGVYSEVEDHGSSMFISATVAILTSAGASAVALGAWLLQSKSSVLASVKALITPIVNQVSDVNPNVKVSVDSIIQQLPSGLIILMMITLAVGVIWDRRLMTMLKLQDRRFFDRHRLTTFTVPDVCVWLVMLAILGAFLKHSFAPVTLIAINAINVFVVLYFFQGLAIVAHAFRTFKVNPFWQGIWYVLIVLQLFLLVAVLGFVDFWLEFRERLARKPAESNKSFE